MKTAKEILISLGVDEDNAAAIEIINEARKEAIEELMNYMYDHSMNKTGTYHRAIQIKNKIK